MRRETRDGEMRRETRWERDKRLGEIQEMGRDTRDGERDEKKEILETVREMGDGERDERWEKRLEMGREMRRECSTCTRWFVLVRPPGIDLGEVHDHCCVLSMQGYSSNIVLTTV